MSRLYENYENVQIDYLADIRAELVSVNQNLVRLLEALQILRVDSHKETEKGI